LCSCEGADGREYCGSRECVVQPALAAIVFVWGGLKWCLREDLVGVFRDGQKAVAPRIQGWEPAWEPVYLHGG
jgi:hypothetical protein